MPNNYLLVLYKHIIQMENENVGLRVCVCGGGGGATIETLETPTFSAKTGKVMVSIFILFLMQECCW